MRQIKAVLELRYQDFAPIFKYKEKILDALNAQGVDKNPVLLENIDIKVTEQFAHVSVEGKRLLIMIERAEKTPAKNFIVGVIDNLERLLNLQNLSIQQIGYRSMFVRESEQSFSDLVEQFKTSLYQPVSLLIDSTDIGSPITFKTDDFRINFMSGPMEYAQLKLMLEFPERIRNPFYFLDVDFIKNDVHISSRYIKDFIAEAQRHQNDLIHKWEEAVIYE